MMLRNFLLALFFVAAFPVQAIEALQGRWAFDLEACAAERGSSDLVPMAVEGEEILFYESVCLIADADPIGTQNSAWHLTLSCTGEGETWETDSIYAVERDSEGKPVALFDLDMDIGSITVRKACPAQ